MKPSTRQYLRAVADLELPSDEQAEQFIEHVAREHSWSRHLTPFPPGDVFLFYINPNSGRSLIESASGETAFVERTEQDEIKAGHQWMTTANYRRRIGYWSYAFLRSIEFQLGAARPGRFGLQPFPSVLDADGQWLNVLDALGEVATCRLTGFIYPSFFYQAAFMQRHEAVRQFARTVEESPDDPEVQRYQPLLQLAQALLAGDEAATVSGFEAFHASEMPIQRDRMRQTLLRTRGFIASARIEAMKA